jgi:plasmid maintenance system antidote protein VapI
MPTADLASPDVAVRAGGRSPRAASPHAGRGRRVDDLVTALAIERLRQAHPSERLLVLTGLTVSEYAKRVEPPVTRARLADVFAQAQAFGRLSADWAARLGRVAGVSAEAVLALFDIAEPSRPGRPSTRRLADRRPGRPAAPAAHDRRSA